ncbi:CHAT domain-containing protein [Reichenbachiella agarivorans]|uniref:CHAT domain-containing protein n=1 Tax=Reichenbachiella agarivorans TaxID=2979464 RepID=A0ABY6CMF1_9BACT|nr:CHAT domain-containing protein [Reichenbachiella agarivorans]UXP31689.1 CHAT domain-containing protein [Reichenbachiella agarivorans]
MNLRFYLLIAFLLFSRYAFSQTQEDYDELMTVVYSHPVNSTEAQAAAKQMYELVEKEEVLQTIANYMILANIYKTQVVNEKQADHLMEKANQLIYGYNPSSKGSDEWMTKHLLEMYLSKDQAKAAAKYLDKHPEFESFNNLNMVAGALSLFNELTMAGKYYEKAMNTELGIDEYRSYSGYAYYLCKMGEYNLVEELIAKMKKLSEESPELWTMSYTLEYLNTQSFYSLLIGDYHSYIIDQKNLFDNYPDQSADECNFVQSSYHSVLATAYELIGNYDQALQEYYLADSSIRASNLCFNTKYPDSPIPSYVYPSYNIFLAQIGRQSDFTKPLDQLLRETNEYYDGLKTDESITELGRASIVGFLGGKDYHDIYQSYLKDLVTRKDFSVSTSPFSTYAFFCVRDRKLETAFDTYKDLFHVNQEWINDLIFTFGEKTFVTYYNSKLKDGYNNYHSFVRILIDSQNSMKNKALEQVYDNLLLTKSISFKSTQKRKKTFVQSNSPEIIARYNQWLAKKQLLIRAYQQHEEQEDIKVLDRKENKPDINLDELQAEVQQLENQLVQLTQNYEELLTISSPGWKEVRDRLQEGEAAIEVARFQWKDQRYYDDKAYYAAYIIRKDSQQPEVVYLPATAEDLDGKYYNLYRNTIQQRLDDSRSYDQYWKPIQERLIGIRKVYFSADGIYHLINLPTLKNGESNQYLLDEIQIQYVTSTANLLEDESTIKPKNSVLLGRPAYDTKGETTKPLSSDELQTRSFIGNFDEQSVIDLPGTEEEILAVKREMEKQRVQTRSYLGSEATEEVLYDLENPSILHIATHGYWNKTDNDASEKYRMFNAMINSGLLLAGVVNYYTADELPMSHDGVLTAYEAQNLALDGTDLVVLSACETGLGHFDAGEGVYGLQRAFRSAGATSIINSLWKVDDQATKDFMIAFYSHYLSGATKLHAFTAAQKSMQTKYNDPYYWGAFVLVGR